MFEDAIMDAQRALNGNMQAPGRGPRVRTSSHQGVEIDGTSRALALMLLGSVATLVLLRLGGFRFSFGANVGGGS